MKITIVTLAVVTGSVLLSVGCASRRVGDTVTPPDQVEVIQAAQDMFDAMATRDTTALRRLLAPEAIFVSTVESQSPVTPRFWNVESFLETVANSKEILNERMRDPQVYIDGNIAMLWAPYTFHRGDRFSHCGHDAFHFVRSEGRWLITAVSYTVRPEPDCSALLRGP